MPYGFHKALAYASLAATCGTMGAIAGPAGIAIGIVSGAALAKVSMKRTPGEKEERRKELEALEKKREEKRKARKAKSKAREKAYNDAWFETCLDYT